MKSPGLEMDADMVGGTEVRFVASVPLRSRLVGGVSSSAGGGWCSEPFVLGGASCEDEDDGALGGEAVVAAGCARV